MIGVLIRDFKAPVDCDSCHFMDYEFGGCFCVPDGKNGYKDTWPRKKGKRAAWCPLIPIEDATAYGYPLNELVAFAVACRRNGVDEADLHEFATNAEFAIKVIIDEQKKLIKEAFANALAGLEDQA